MLKETRDHSRVRAACENLFEATNRYLSSDASVSRVEDQEHGQHSASDMSLMQPQGRIIRRLPIGYRYDDFLDELPPTIRQIPGEILWRAICLNKFQAFQVSLRDSTSYLTWDQVTMLCQLKANPQTVSRKCHLRFARHIRPGHRMIDLLQDFDPDELDKEIEVERREQVMERIQEAAVRQETLIEQARLSLPSRATALSTPECRVAPEQVRQWYHQARIENKKVVRVKGQDPNEKAAKKREIELKQLDERFQYCCRHGYEIIYLDEVIFQPNEVPTSAWSNMGENIEVPIDKLKGHASVVVIAAINKNGLVEFETHQRFLNTEMYVDYLFKLREKVDPQQNKRIALLFDGLPVHKAKSALRVIVHSFGWIPLLNVAYSPRMNPIELYFARLKHAYRNKLLEFASKYKEGQRVQQSRLALVQEVLTEYQHHDCSGFIRNATKELTLRTNVEYDKIQKKDETALDKQQLVQKVVEEHELGF